MFRRQSHPTTIPSAKTLLDSLFNQSTIGCVHHCFHVQPGGGTTGIAVHQGISLRSRGGEAGTSSGRVAFGGSAKVQPDGGGARLST